MTNRNNLLNELKTKYGRAEYGKDIGIVNKSGAAILTKENGNIDISADKYSQIKLDKKNSAIINQSLHSIETSVIKEMNFTDLTMNKHKFNNKLIELSDLRTINDGLIMGGLLMNGTVLVKTWSEHLNKWVLIRRPISQQMFSNRLNIPAPPEQFEINLNMEEDIIKYLLKKEGEV